MSSSGSRSPFLVWLGSSGREDNDNHQRNLYKPDGWGKPEQDVHDLCYSDNFYKPDAWKVALEATQEKSAPSAEMKDAAQRHATAELVQQATGWLLLTQTGVLLGSFGQLLPVGLCLLIFVIFMLEATLKFLRNWTHGVFFMNIPCAYVPLHEATRDALPTFERWLKRVLLLELSAYGLCTFFAIHNLTETAMCFNDDHYLCGQGGASTAWLTLLCSVTVLLHGLTSVVAWCTFNAAMGGSLVSCSSHRSHTQRRVLCLTWWVHLARHRHLSAVVAQKESMNCGLPGHWFETVQELMSKVRDCVDDKMGDHVMNSQGPLCDSLTMALNAIVCLANNGTDAERSRILEDGGFDLLTWIAREGKVSSCQKLAAAAIGIFARSPKLLREHKVDLRAAVNSLKTLARSRERELKEVALGALLNTVLDDHQLKDVLTQFESEADEILRAPGESFMRTVMATAYSGPTTRCRELAMGLLARLAGKGEGVWNSLRDEINLNPPGNERSLEKGGRSHSRIVNLVKLLRLGPTAKIRANSAGILAELAKAHSNAIAKGPDIEACVEALFQAALEGEPRLAYPSTRALSNLAKSAEAKSVIMDAGGVSRSVELLTQKRFKLLSPLQARGTGTSIGNKEGKSALTQDHVQAEAARLLFVLSFRDAESQDQIARAGAIPLLVKLLQNRHPKVYTHALAAFTGILWHNPVNQDRIAEFGNEIMPRIVEILKCNNDQHNENGVEMTTLAIIAIIDNHRKNRDMLIQEKVMDVLWSIAGIGGSYQGMAVQRAQAALERFKEDLEDDQMHSLTFRSNSNSSER